ncbi:hypothetical protein L2Y94_10990 [Luteibacter aegosomatis]|uniref:hypothetical protein n=1 Tax=Luteibacter aegosomatis TaxID=2911537 RepID=UPI001FF70BF6|nr:hypothetical protein [Luteibacter aegosomatis]UPG83884.1 hypothetical protein L2Y94_10990 [Luteibacter aegosomatis]
MNLGSIDRAAYLRLANATNAAASGILNIHIDNILEALASALGYRTWASLNSKFQSDPDWRPEAYDHFGFIQRLYELMYAKLASRIEERDLPDEQKRAMLVNAAANALATTEATAVLVEGARLDVSVIRRPPEQQRADKYLDVAYDVEATVRGIPSDALAGERWFLLPEFSGQRANDVIIDSNFDFRVELAHDLTVTRDRAGKKLRTAALEGGVWRGGLFVVAADQAEEDSRVIKNVKVALARAILPPLTRQVHLRVFQPDSYMAEAYRAELTYGPAALGTLGGKPFTFDIDLGGSRWIHAPKDGLTFGRDGNPRGLVRNGTWAGEIYPRSGPQTPGLISITAARLKILEAAYRALQVKPQATAA